MSIPEDGAESAYRQWDAAKRRALLYLDGLDLAPRKTLELALQAIKTAEADTSGTRPSRAVMDALRGLLSISASMPADLDSRDTRGFSPAPLLSPVPPLMPGEMPEARLEGLRFFGWLSRKSGRPVKAQKREQTGSAAPGWRRTAHLRRAVIFLSIALTTYIASHHMAGIFPHRGGNLLELAIVVVFSGLFAWISIGFWEAMGGLFVLLRRRDRFSLTRHGEGKAEGSESERTAIVMPVCDENVSRVFAGLRATYGSLQETGDLAAFDFFVLSDTRDPNTWVDEETAWRDLSRNVNGGGRIFYRHRRLNERRKTGNIGDFLRQWGKHYAYMIVFDADSIMNGRTMVRLVRMMKANPRIGIIQTLPKAVNRESLIARAQQYASHVYAPVQTAGLHFLQLGDSHFWGHNAILRVAPFMRHCGLPRLPGNPPLGGEIMSHDFVEAALMRKAGWEVWLAYDLEGSYEEVPSTVHDELKRDQRWCQGNLQHIRLLFQRGLSPAHRALFLYGILSYFSALLWLLFLGLSTSEAVLEAFRTPDYFPVQHSLFPSWPRWYPQWAITLLGTTAVLLFLPKLLSVLYILLVRRGSAGYGGIGRLLAGMFAEIAISALLAPVRMIHQCKFVLAPILGLETAWKPQARGDHGIGWREAFRFHFGATVLGSVWGTLLFVYNRPFFWWNLPVFFPLVLSAPLAVIASSVRLGRVARRLGLFIIPEEIRPPAELRRLREFERALQEPDVGPGFPSPWKRGFVRAVVDPATNAMHRSILDNLPTERKELGELREGLLSKALSGGPDGLSSLEKMDLLSDPAAMDQLHEEVWNSSVAGHSERWGLA